MGPKLHRFFIWKKFSSAFLCNLWPLRKTGCTCFWIFVTNACIYIWRRTEIKFLYEIFIIHYNWGDEMTSLYTLHLQKPSYLSRILHLNGWFKGTTLWNYFEIIRKWFVIMQVLYCLISVAKSHVRATISSYVHINLFFEKDTSYHVFMMRYRFSNNKIIFLLYFHVNPKTLCEQLFGSKFHDWIFYAMSFKKWLYRFLRSKII